MGQQREALLQPLDILVGTPQKLVQHAEKGHLFWGDVQYVVLDEADTMFDKGFGPEVKAVLGPLRSKAQPASVVLVVATLSQVRCYRLPWLPFLTGINSSHEPVMEPYIDVLGSQVASARPTLTRASCPRLATHLACLLEFEAVACPCAKVAVSCLCSPDMVLAV